jgi:hypothetical protein
MSASSGEAMPREDHRKQLGAEGIIAWAFIGMWLASLIRAAANPWVYVESLGNFFGRLPLKLLVALVASQPSAFATIWLARRHGQRTAERSGPHLTTGGGPGR